jgi:hypothetical protein
MIIRVLSSLYGVPIQKNFAGQERNLPFGQTLDQID